MQCNHHVCLELMLFQLASTRQGNLLIRSLSRTRLNMCVITRSFYRIARSAFSAGDIAGTGQIMHSHYKLRLISDDAGA